MIKQLTTPTLLILMMLVTASILTCFTLGAQASNRFQSSYPCADNGKYCASGGMRVVQGFEVYRDCWEWIYNKQCNYPSKDDCSELAKCYSLGQRDCVLRDSLGNCVNILKEFSCKRWIPTFTESETIRYGAEDKEGIKGLVCEGIPCIDGNCIDKSYEMDADMVSSVAQLGALSQGKSDGVNFKIFEGLARHCTKKPTGYQSCCQVFPKGWGQKLGAKCSKDEEILSEKRQKNLCVYVGKSSSKTAGITTLIKHHYCCFSNILEKTVQVQARKQPAIKSNFSGKDGFGSDGNPNCRGLTLDELSKVDFSTMDFSEVAAEMQKKIVMPNIADVKGRINDSFKSSNKFDTQKEAHPKNKAAGVNSTVKEE